LYSLTVSNEKSIRFANGSGSSRVGVDDYIWFVRSTMRSDPEATAPSRARITDMVLLSA